MNRNRTRKGFSLIELVIVVVIMAIIGAIAIPRLSRGSEGAAESALIADLATMRNAIDLYQTEHQGALPAYATIVAQLTTYTDINGNANATKTGAFIYGPYLRAVPPCPVGPEKGQNGITNVAGTAANGWVYTEATGTIVANTGVATDAQGVLFNTY